MSPSIGATGLPGWYRSLALCVAACFGISTVGDLPFRPAVAQAPPPGAAAPAPVAAPAGESRLTQPQLEQLLAPIALHPDTLLAEMLMASTYPLEVVQAQRWLGRGGNGKLQGEALAQALQTEPWDDSVKSLILFPDVLKMMNEQLEWTQQIGDAVLAQQADVLNAVQVLRNRAQQAGKLESGSQQTITVSQNVQVARPADPVGGGVSGNATPVSAAVAPPPQIITIEPAQPDQVYVPAYDPSVVYGSWPYPSYPPPYYPPPAGWGVGSALVTGMAFAGGVALIGSIWGGAGCGWGSGDINVNSSRVRNVDRSRTTGDVGNRWQHNTAHRQGVAYRNEEVKNRFQGDRSNSAAARDQFRGRVDQADRGGAGDRGGPGDRGGVGERGGPGERGGVGDRSGSGPGDRAGAARSNPAGSGQAARAGDNRPARTGAGERAPAAGGARGSGTQGSAARGNGAQGSGARSSGAQGGGARSSGERAAGTAGGRANSVGQAPSGRPTVSGQGAQGRQAASAPRSAQSFQGIGQGGDVRAASQRGQASRQSPPSPRAAPSGGGGGGARAASAGGYGGGGRAAAGGGGARGGGGGGGRGGGGRGR